MQSVISENSIFNVLLSLSSLSYNRE
jgi:hypothetical protein